MPNETIAVNLLESSDKKSMRNSRRDTEQSLNPESRYSLDFNSNDEERQNRYSVLSFAD